MPGDVKLWCQLLLFISISFIFALTANGRSTHSNLFQRFVWKKRIFVGVWRVSFFSFNPCSFHFIKLSFFILFFYFISFSSTRRFSCWTKRCTRGCRWNSIARMWSTKRESGTLTPMEKGSFRYAMFTFTVVFRLLMNWTSVIVHILFIYVCYCVQFFRMA